MVKVNVFVYREVTTADKPANQAHAQGRPDIPAFNALLADVRRRLSNLDKRQVFAILFLQLQPVERQPENDLRDPYRIFRRKVCLLWLRGNPKFTQGND